jgi:hypothetical protein
LRSELEKNESALSRVSITKTAVFPVSSALASPLVRPGSSPTGKPLTRPPEVVLARPIAYNAPRRSSSDAASLNKSPKNAPSDDLVTSIQELKRNILSLIDSIERNAKRKNFVKSAANALDDAAEEFLDFFAKLLKSPKLEQKQEEQQWFSENLKKFDHEVLEFIEAAESKK